MYVDMNETKVLIINKIIYLDSTNLEPFKFYKKIANYFLHKLNLNYNLEKGNMRGLKTYYGISSSVDIV